jgi:hypothetical protein
MPASFTTKSSRNERRRQHRGEKPVQAFHKEVLLQKTHDSGRTKTSKRERKGMTKAMARERLHKYEFGFRVQATNEMVYTNRIEETVFLEYMKHFENP